MMSSSGLYVGMVGVNMVDLDRVDRVLGRIVRGLFYKTTDNFLPEPYKPYIYDREDFERYEAGGNPQLIQVALATMNDSLHTFGDNVFSYRLTFAKDDDCAIVCWM